MSTEGNLNAFNRTHWLLNVDRSRHMLNTTVIDVVIGLVFVYLLLSLMCSAANEMIEGWLKNRAADLERGLRELLKDPKGNGLVKKVYDHPLISGLFEGTYDPQEVGKPAGAG